MVECGDDRTALHVVHAEVRQPVEGLHEEQKREEGDEPRAEVVAKDCERQTRLRHRIEELLNELLQDEDAMLRVRVCLFI